MHALGIALGFALDELVELLRLLVVRFAGGDMCGELMFDDLQLERTEAREDINYCGYRMSISTPVKENSPTHDAWHLSHFL